MLLNSALEAQKYFRSSVSTRRRYGKEITLAHLNEYIYQPTQLRL